MSDIGRQPSILNGPAQAVSVRDFVKGTLERGLLDGSFQPGAKLKPHVIAASLGVSATPVREALIDLTHAGLVRPSMRRGFRAAPLSVVEARELYPLMATLEIFAMRQAPPQAQDLAVLDRINAEIKTVMGGGALSSLIELDAAWHRHLTAGCANATLHTMLDDLRRQIHRYEGVYMRESGPPDSSVSEHAAISSALRRKDLAAAARFLQKNWLKGLTFITKWMASRDHHDRVADGRLKRRSNRVGVLSEGMERIST